ncbi:hypothetical protein ACO2Q9_05070 [Variovorax sp. VNK109]|uniref:hypothetical protein n=1 Tax=Variovorax sp. VNK109 TaxID=3400919 RepID=UPI003C050F92
MKAAAIVIASAVALAACGEKPQTIGSGIKQDSTAYSGTGSNFTAPGWKAGDRTSWEQELKARAQGGQNEYNKVSKR